MSSNLEDLNEGKIRYYGMQIGTVTNNADELGLHRVKVKIPGIIEPESAWCYPMTSGGGSPARGGHLTPAVGSTVCCWFHQGDPEGTIAYVGGWPGMTDAGSEMPNDAKAETNPELLQVLEVDGLRITIDERPGKRSLKVYDISPTTGKVNSSIVLDREKNAILLSAKTAILLKTLGQINLEGAVITINDRIVAASPKPI